MGDCLNMKTLNQDYIKLLRNHGVADLGDNYKKHIKDIISSEVQNIVFVHPKQRNESEQVMLDIGAVDNLIEDKNMAVYVDFTRITKLLCRELLENRARWTFSGSFDEYIYDTIVKMFYSLVVVSEKKKFSRRWISLFS